MPQIGYRIFDGAVAQYFAGAVVPGDLGFALEILKQLLVLLRDPACSAGLLGVIHPKLR
ncbi:hypothetical protein [Bradyrhizobium sp. RDI18]|uniref:hypothetical protein n=1 Tax=Bradyrhizobium sp. RDI18 TaxID=3367400 RepID=UPI00371614BB